MKCKLALLFILISTSMFYSAIMTSVSAQSTIPCDSCGMGVDGTGQARFQIVDGDGHQHVACCPICAFKLIKTYGQLNITSFCDWNGPSYPIAIIAKQNGSVLTINPQSALVILGGGCPRNRMVYDAAAANSLLSQPQNGTSRWLSPLTNATVLSNATKLGVAQAVLQYAGGTTSACEQCGMTVDVTGQARFKIFDSTGTLHIACCPICALRLQKTYNNLNITAFCDYYGPSYPITISSRNNGTDVTVTPSDALIIAAGSCTKNRIVYNSSAADALLAPPNNGTSKWLSILTNGTVAANATRMDVAQAALMNGAGLPSPSPSPLPSPSPSASPIASPSSSSTSSPDPSPTPYYSQPPITPKVTSTPTYTENPTTTSKLTPTPTLSPQLSSSPAPTATTPTTTNTAIQQCEACGMDVTPESQVRYKIIDGGENIHYVECYMCALNLVNDYETLHIATYCDWYGPNYPIVVDSSNYGSIVTISPSTTIFLRGGSCVTARVAYNQTAADNLLESGFSKYTSPEQQYAMPSTTEVKLVREAISTWYAQPKTTNSPTPLILVLIVVVGVAFIAGSIVAYQKLSKKI